MITRKERFIAELTKLSPDLKIAFKDESLLMKIIGFLLFFNPKFKTGFVTTIGNTIYFPSKKNFREREDWSAMMTLAHEFRHIQDHQKYGLWYNLTYLFPLCLLPLVLAAGFLLPWWLTLVLLVLCLAPLPSPWRKNYEFRGYTMNLFVFNQLAEESKMLPLDKFERLDELVEHYNSHFTNFHYYLMWPFGVKDKMDDCVDDIVSGEIEKTDDIFGKVSEALKSSK
jgi:hypothetical protein